ncbi:MAG: NTP transferase domain-containing protein [Deltaproteobacteria bacterium]|nr:NTP transferase domain-containing protein [Deltaproteobacteria bacterium]
MKLTTAVILAGGKGTRMGQLETLLPKCLFPVLGKTLLKVQLEVLADMGVGVVHVVCSPAVIAALSREARSAVPDLDCRFITQENPHGSADALSRLSGAISGPFLLWLGDIHLPAEDVVRMAENFDPARADGAVGVAVGADSEEVKKNFSVETDRGGRILQVEEKPVAPASRVKGVGVYVLPEAVFSVLGRLAKNPRTQALELTDALQAVADEGFRLLAHPVKGPDFNVNTPADLLALNLRLLGDRESWAGPGADIAPDARVEKSVVGAGAQVGRGAVVERSLVFPGAGVEDGARLCRVIVTEQNSVCPVGGREGGA